MNVAKADTEQSAVPPANVVTEAKAVIETKPDPKEAPSAVIEKPVEEKVAPVSACIEESAKMSDCMMEQQQQSVTVAADPQQQQQMQIDQQQQQHHLMEQCAVAQQQKLEQQAIEQQASMAAGMMEQQTAGGWSAEMTGAGGGYDETVSGYQCTMYTPDSSTASVHSIGHGYSTDTGHDTGGYSTGVQPQAGDGGAGQQQGGGGDLSGDTSQVISSY